MNLGSASVREQPMHRCGETGLPVSMGKTESRVGRIGAPSAVLCRAASPGLGSRLAVAEGLIWDTMAEGGDHITSFQKRNSGSSEYFCWSFIVMRHVPL